MKRLFLFFSLSLLSLAVFSQKIYFIYLQSERDQPFFVKMNEKIYSSSASGHLILSKLVDSSYSFKIGFPQNKWPEQEFSVTLGAKDHGFLVKDFGDKGWGLFDLQNISVQMAKPSEQKIAIATEKKEVSTFTHILSKAANDSTLTEKPIVVKTDIPEQIPGSPKEQTQTTPALVKAEKKNEQQPNVETMPDKTPVVGTDILPVKKDTVITEVTLVEVKEEPPTAPPPAIPVLQSDSVINNPVANTAGADMQGRVNEEQPFTKSTVKKKSESSTTEGFGLTFLDQDATGRTDTISILIPNKAPVTAMITEEPKEEKKFLDISTTPEQRQQVVKKDSVIQKTADIVKEAHASSMKNNCKNFAAESDFLKLRKKMAAAESDDKMLGEARRYFKLKCFATQQIKNLSSLFLSDKGKYSFYETAYSYVSDTETFPVLQLELKDDYYIGRFKAILHK